jgi:hypothetical protein
MGLGILEDTVLDHVPGTERSNDITLAPRRLAANITVL